jgi:hypothetical protein
LAAYLVAAAYMSFAGNTAAIAGDGVSRVAIANRILFSRDPHLAAIGFVWSPIPVLALLPLVALKPIWPVLVTNAFAGNIMSAVFMAGAVAVMLRLLTDLGLNRWLRWALTAAFALHPMIVMYAANSMSEACFIFFLLLMVRELHLWLRTRKAGPLVSTGFYLGLAYLTRYEAGAAAMAVTGVVCLATFMTSAGGFRHRLRPALLDSMIVAGPFLVAFVGWEVASWLLTGVPFQQLSATYGTSMQVQAQGIHGVTSLSQVLPVANQALQWALSMEPFLPIAVLACLVVVFWRRDWAALGAPVVLGAVLAFMFYVYMTGKDLPGPRYYIVVIPLVFVMVGVVLSRQPAPSPVAPAPHVAPSNLTRLVRTVSSQRGAGSRALRRFGPLMTATAALVAMAATIPAGYQALVSNTDNPGFAAAVQTLMTRGPLTSDEKTESVRFAVERQVSQYMESLHLRRGSVLIDDFLGFVIILSSSHSDQYVITSDRDFQQILSDPSANGVQYVLIPPDRGLGQLDAINRAYPNAYTTGQGIGTLVKAFHDPSDYDHDWRLYRVSPTG